jgi:hypothetical protein
MPDAPKERRLAEASYAGWEARFADLQRAVDAGKAAA